MGGKYKGGKRHQIREKEEEEKKKKEEWGKGGERGREIIGRKVVRIWEEPMSLHTHTHTHTHTQRESEASKGDC